MVNPLVFPFEQQLGDATAGRTLVKLLRCPQDVQDGVDRPLATSTLHLPLQRSPARVLAESLKRQDSSAGVALFPVGLRVLGGDPEKPQPKPLRLQRRVLPEFSRPVW